jgi:hypothetical protein
MDCTEDSMCGGKVHGLRYICRIMQLNLPLSIAMLRLSLRMRERNQEIKEYGEGLGTWDKLYR